jgi:PLP dependent protein
VLSREEIRANVAAVNARIEAACARAGRDRRDVTLVAVSKTFPPEAVRHAAAAGITDIGENRVQEAREKKDSQWGAGAPLRWHLIGHLQSNKAKDAVRIFDMIQTVDSAGLAEKIAKAAESIGKRQEVLLQINIGREEQKSGADPRDAASIMRSIETMDSLLLRGLMTIPPADDDQRRWFRELRAIRDDLGLKELSMGMSEDYAMAIEEGSTIVRVGRAIFGSRG